uniref:U3 small nucleolar RNA-associated protein 20 N-terminal domain-containing protein n=1 Tax=Plectus sambesii TaxID=2011161 RepID=A0A914WC35_9BILA
MPKSENRFQFVSFTERIARVTADVSTWYKQVSSAAEEESTFFYETLIKCGELEGNNEFLNDFVKAIPVEQLRTYTQVLHFQKKLASELEKHLQVENSSAFAILFQLVVALARDIRDDFYQYMWTLFTAITNALERSKHDPEVLEAGFVALAVLFKLQWRHITKDMRKAFCYFIPLFGSRENYMRRFAAEAFAFVFRKSNSVEKFVAFAAKKAAKSDDGFLLDGVAELYFNTFKGVSHQFHSRAQMQFELVLKATLSIEDETQRNTAVEIVDKLIKKMVAFTRKEHSKPITDVLLKFLDLPSSDKRKESVTSLARLLTTWIEYKRGAIFQDYDRLFTIVHKIVRENPDRSESVFLDFISLLLQLRSEAVDKNGQRTKEIVESVLSAQALNVTLAVNFVTTLTDVPGFDVNIMPVVGQFAERVLNQANCARSDEVVVLNLYARICAKRRPISTSDLMQHGSASRRPFMDARNHTTVREHVIKAMDSLDAGVDQLSLERLVPAVAILPWLWRSGETVQGVERVVDILESILDDDTSVERVVDILESILDDDTSKFGPRAGAFALICATTALLIDDKSLASIKRDRFLDFIRRQCCLESSVQLLELVQQRCADWQEMDAVERLKETAEVLSSAFLSPHSVVRRAALGVMAAFPVQLEANDDEKNGGQQESVFDVLLEAESTDLTIQNYRHRLMLVRKLAHGSHRKFMPIGLDKELEWIPLKVILAQFYENFALLWPPLYAIAETYARGMPIDDFWTLFAPILEAANERAASSATSVDTTTAGDDEVGALLEQLVGTNSARPADDVTFRLHMWRLVSRFADVAERRTRIISPMLLKLAREEYKVGESSGRSTEDLSATIKEPVTEEVVEEEEDEDEEKPAARKRPGRRSVTKALVAILDTFAQFQDPKSVYLEPQIAQLYDELLLVPDETVQTAVMKCIFTYKHKFLTPYKENLERLVSDKSFRDELVMFSIDTQDSAVAEEHRKEFMPVLM